MISEMQKQMLEAAAAHSAERLDNILDVAVAMGDWDTADYIADNMFAKLSADVQEALYRNGVVARPATVH